MPKPSASYKTKELKIPADLVEPIQGVTPTTGSWQSPFQQIKVGLKKVGDDWVARVREKDIQDMKKFSQNPKAGSYQKWSAEILELNDMAPDS